MEPTSVHHKTGVPTKGKDLCDISRLAMFFEPYLGKKANWTIL